MRSRGTGLFEWWRSQQETGDLLRRTNQLRLPPAHLTQLLGDSGVRAALQGTKMASLLPPVGTEVFRRLTPASLERMRQEAEEAESQVKKKKNKKAAKSDRPEPACDLEAGKPLPFFYGAPPPELLNTPLEELDPFYQSQKTFVVLGKGNVLYRFSAESSCYLLTPFNLLRSAAIRVLLHSLFSLFMTATILTNCAFMMLSEPPAWSRSAEHVFTAIYTLEVIIKVTSQGLCLGHFTFLRDPWNWLDVLVILTGLRPFLESGLNDVIFLRVPWNWLNFLIISKIYLSEIFYLKSVSVLKTIPRILKIIAVSPGLRSTVRGLITLVRRLADVIMLTVFWLCVLALIGLQLFMGSLRQKCVISRWTLSDENISLTETQFDFNEYINNEVNYYYLPGQLDALLCGNSSDAGVCPEGFVCLMAGNNPNYGFTSYDSFGWSLLNMIRLLSQDFWENLLQMTLRSSGKFYLSFFLLVVFPSCFCILCLIMAAVVMACVKREEVGATEAREREEEFREVLETLKRTEDEEASCGMALSQGQDRHNNQHQGHTAGTGTCSDVLLKWECCGCWRWLHQRLHTVITNPFFDLAIIVCIIVDILFMSMEHYPMTEEFAVHLSIADLVFQLVYTVELLLKLVALGPCGYFKVNWNVFDCIIITVTLLNLVLGDIQGLSVLRTFRLLRMFRLARWWPSLHVWLRMVSTSVRALREPTILLLVLTFFFSVVGMQLFGTDYKDHVCRISMDCQLPRWHMNDFFHAFLVVFRALTGESVETLWDCMQVSGQPLCLIFFMVLLVLGNLLMLNLFLVLLLSPLSSYCLTEEKKKISMQISINRIQRAVRTLLGKKTQMDPDHKAVSSDQENRKELLAMTAVTSEQPESEVTALSSDQNSDSCWVSAASDVKVPEREKDKEKKKHDEDDEGHIPEDCCNDKCYRCCPFLDKDMSRGGGRVWSNFRRTCCSLVQHRGFDAFIIVIIVASSTALAFEDVHLQQHTVLKTVLETADQVFTFILLMEVILKIIAFGLKKYFTDAWCWLDFLVLHVFLVSLAADTFGAFELGAISFLRTLRALGPLRVLSRFQGPRLVVGTLVRSVPSLLNVLLVSLQVWLFFGLLGVNFFAGKFYHCFNETSEELVLPEVVDNKSECVSLIMHNFTEIRWKNIRNINFDNTNNAYLSLLHVMTGDGFDIIYAAVDTRQVESQLVYESKPYAHLYFIFFTVFGVFFTFNFIIRHIMDNLLRDKSAGRRLFVTEEQQKFWAVMKMRALRPQKAVPRPQGVCRAGLFDLVTGAPFSVLMAVVICLNMVVLMIETRDQSETMDIVLSWLHFVFILIFLIEFILKIIALGCHYFSDGYNVLDFLVLIITIVGLFLADLIEKYFLSPVLFSVLRLCRVARLFSLLRFARGVGKLLLSLMMSLPVLFNVGVLLLVLVVASSIFAMFNFAYVRKAYTIDDIFNFETFWSSFICLIMTTMTASWGGLLMALTNTPPDCDPFEEHPGSTVTGDCGSPMLAIIFFCTHVALSLLLIVHLYVAVILKILEPDNGVPLSDDQLQMFYEIWRRFDPEGSQSIQHSQLSEFCDALKDPLRVPNPNSATLIHMDLPRLPGDQIHCADVLFALSTQVFGFSGQLETLKVKMEEKFVNNSAKEPPELVNSTLQRKQEDVEMAVI